MTSVACHTILTKGKRMENRYYPQDALKVAASLKKLAEAEAAYLQAYVNHRALMKTSTPVLAAHQYAMSAKLSVERMLQAEYKDEPLLASLPLLEMKANLILAKYPDAEQKLRLTHRLQRDVPHLYPVPPKG